MFCLNPLLSVTWNFSGQRQLKRAPKASNLTLHRWGWEWQAGQTSISYFLTSEGLYRSAEEGLQYECVIWAVFSLEAELVPRWVSIKSKVTCACQERINRVWAGWLAAIILLYPVSKEKEKNLSLQGRIITEDSILHRNAKI